MRAMIDNRLNNIIVISFFLIWPIPGLFFFIFVFSKQLTVYADGWIRTANLWIGSDRSTNTAQHRDKFLQQINDCNNCDLKRGFEHG